MIGTGNFKEIIMRSQARCLKWKISKQRKFPLRTLKGNELYNHLEINSNLINISRSFMEILYDFLNGSGFSLYLTDKDGFVLSIIGDKDIIKFIAEVGIVEGADMSENSTGTNAIGTAIYENCSVQTSGGDHYITAYYIFTCSAAVIHNEEGSIIGCLNLTGRRQLAHPHSLGLIVAAVKSIENQLKVEKTQNELFIACQYLNKVMNSLNSGIFAVDTTGIIKAINKSACIMLDIKEEEVIYKNAEKVLANWKYILCEIIAGKAYENREINYPYKDKSKKFNFNAYPIKNKDNKIIGIVAIFNDIKNIYSLVNKYTDKNSSYNFHDIIGDSQELTKVIEQSKIIANSPSTVLIQGESGTGKELIAQSIHNNSSRSENSFIAINCGAIPTNLIESELFGYEDGAFTGAKRGGQPGKFELANGGTIFLDEIGEMPFEMQIHLLRVLEVSCFNRVGGNKPITIDVRIVAATNKDLKKEVKKGTFREDLYYRLNVIPIFVPPLRERCGDIDLLIEYFLRAKAIKLGKPIPKISPDIYEMLINYNWPGNVRELENCIENIVNMNGNTSFKFGNESLEKNETVPSKEVFKYNMCTLEQWDQIAIKNCIKKCNGNITEASKVLGINRSTIYSKIKKHNS
ncbi:sigma 54-interacting transcriptional regulator [Clostridium estertheticum]|uniref:sigma-54-dependent Fis family transcriptional regulator n=1 Tax=Clostridium estertheticum TaxID=238834 RepID=UPI001C7DE2A1|nr:sigma 54-interacting transcriptional regulator [Clostridium estertheticum]MBX4259525.1 sigma 54-interacting transcriptional regulator [Clostridium estertheticum]WLC70819.1 sigma 54-interacting transcriptional regulator [Clostridium estertheticum]